MTFGPHEPHSYHVRIDSAGRVTIPADLRHQQGLRSGDEMVLVLHATGLELRTYDQVLRDAQETFCAAAPPSRRLSAELIADRKRDADLDD